jgi:sigma-E factor negative regulatory protein RseB
MLRVCGAVLALATSVAQAQSPETLTWLRKIHEATQRLSYTGTFVYQNGGRTETSRITRFVDPAGDIEKLEIMDGVPREIVRTKDTVRCYLPDSRVVKVDRRTERGFPALVPERISALARHYDISLGETRRIAGFDCQAVVLQPKDNLRYGYKLYADVNSGMLLRAVTVDAAGNNVEQFTFTQLSLGNVSRDMVRPRHAVKA